MKQTWIRWSGYALGIFLSLVIWGLSSAWGQPKPDAPPDPNVIRLTEAMRDTLPENVQAVFTGPDHRHWFVRRREQKNLQLDAIKQEIANQFARPSPELWNIEPVLFEPGGRIWFFVPLQINAFDAYSHAAHSPLLGYDGKTWIQRDSVGDEMFSGCCVNQYRMWSLRTAPCLWLEGKAIFPFTTGVAIYDGRQWTMQVMSKTLNPQGILPNAKLMKESDDKGIVMVLPGEGKKIPTIVWRYRDGRWSEINVKSKTVGLEIHAVALHEQTLVILGSRETKREGAMSFVQTRLVQIPLQSSIAAAKPADVPNLIKQLGAVDFNQREEASRLLMEMGESVVPDLETAALKTTDAEIKARIKRITEAIAKGQPEVAVADAGSTDNVLGGYEILNLSQLYNDAEGNLYLVTQSVQKSGDTRDLGPGVLVLPATGASVFFPTKDLKGEGPMPTWPAQTPVCPVVAKPGLVWFPSLDQATAGCLLNLRAGKVEQIPPDREEIWPLSVDADGTFFYKTHKGEGSFIATYRAGGADTRQFLQCVSLPILRSNSFCVDRDGAIYLEHVQQGVVEFDGKKCIRLPEMQSIHQLNFLFGGQNGALLFGRGEEPEVADEYGLRMGGKVQTKANLEQLLMENRAAIVKAFAGPPYKTPSFWQFPPMQYPSTMLYVDKAQNIWLLHDRRVKVLVGNQWLDLFENLRNAGTENYPRELFDLGDGNSVYLTDYQQPSENGRSFVATIKAGKIELTPAAHSERHAPSATTVIVNRSNPKDVKLWIWAEQYTYANGPQIKGHKLIELTGAGPLDDYIVHTGQPLFADNAGQLWMRTYENNKTGLATWNPEKLGPSTSLGTVLELNDFVYDGAGSLFIPAGNTLLHLTADPQPTGLYNMNHQYILQELSGQTRVQMLLYSPKLRMMCLSTPKPNGAYGDPSILIGIQLPAAAKP